jgi:phospholipid/cholesterol/gamma-HCH transport system substrate-binding protein
MTPEAREEGRGLGDQIRRYRAAFFSIVAMILIAAVVGGYILAHERLTLPGWVPVIGQEYVTLKGEFQTAQAVAPGQGQSVTIAGAKIGEIASVDLQNGEAMVTMHLTPKYARIYRNATMLLRPKTQLKDMSVEINPGTPSAGRVPNGGVIPVSQTAPDVNVDEFLAALDADTRSYLQELLAGAGEGLKEGNGRRLGAAFKRFDPLAKDLALIGKQVAVRHKNVEGAIHNFRLLLDALGSKDKDLAELVDSSNAVFKTFASEDKSVQAALREFPEALKQTKQGLGKLATAARVVGPTLHKLTPFAKDFGASQRETRPFFEKTAPVFKSQIRPFARQILPVITQLQPSIQNLAQASPDLATSFSVLNEFFNEAAYNPGPNQGGFLFFLDWAAHNFNSVLAQTDAHGALGHTLVYFNRNLVPILNGAREVNPSANLILGLLNPPSPTEAACKTASSGAATGAKGTAAKAGASSLASSVFSKGPDAFARPSTAIGGGG